MSPAHLKRNLSYSVKDVNSFGAYFLKVCFKCISEYIGIFLIFVAIPFNDFISQLIFLSFTKDILKFDSLSVQKNNKPGFLMFTRLIYLFFIKKCGIETF